MSLQNATMVLTSAASRRKTPAEMEPYAEFLAELLGLMAADRHTEAGSTFFQRFRRSEDYLIVAEAFVGTVVLDLQYCENVAVQTTRPVAQLDSFSYRQGVLLGLFQAANWLDREWRDASLIENYEQALVQGLLNLLHLPGDFIEGKRDRGYENLLSESVKAYVRPTREQGIRRAAVVTLLERLWPLVEKGPRVEGCTLLNLVVNQLCYAVYGDISTRARLEALIEWNRSLETRPTA